jgi:hypothetical protein
VLPTEAESIGREHVTATYLGREWRLPLDVDTWPLDAVKCSVGIAAGHETVVNTVGAAGALAALLAEQWPEFMAAAPAARDLVPATHAFASAAGIGPTAERSPDGELYDRVWGAIPRLLAVLETWPTAVESDLHRFWGVDYRDRWRFDADNRRLLTLRQIYARISHLPADSALAIVMGRRSPIELLTMDVFEAVAGQAHPARPLTPEQAVERKRAAEAKRKAIEAYEKRREARGVAAGLAAARENAKRGEASVEEV